MTFNNIFLGMCIAPLLLTVSTVGQTNQDEFYSSALRKMIHSLNWENQPPVVRGDFASEGMKIFVVNVTNFYENQFVISELHEVLNITFEKIISTRSQKTPVSVIKDHKKGKVQSKTKIQLDSTSNSKKQEKILQLIGNFSNLKFKPSSKGVPHKIYPEIVIYLLSSFVKQFNYSYFDMEAYVLTLVNGVDLNFRTMDSPKIRLSITAIVLLELDSLNEDQNEYFLLDFAKHANDYSKKSGINSDINILIIGNETLIQNNQFENIAVPCSACIKYNTTFSGANFKPSTAIVFDDTMFSGISKLTQKLAILFCSPLIRALHLKDEDTDSCSNIIDILFRTNKSKHYLFSECEEKSMSAFLSTEQAECLRNKPSDKKRSIFERILPGADTSLAKQCQNAGFDKSTEISFVNSRNKGYYQIIPS